jgi:hypothetical protein
MRSCTVCGLEKPAEDFYSGYARCKECHCAAVRHRRATNPAVQLYDRERGHLPHRRANSTAQGKKWRAANPLATTAHTRVRRALKAGRLVKVDCACGEPGVHAHHDDYAKPLDVVWKCVRCHRRDHDAKPF